MREPIERDARGSGDSTIPVFLSLFVLLLAFFIMLTAISRHEQTRAAAAIGSVAAVFRDEGSLDSLEAIRRSGVALDPASAFHEDMRRLLEATLPITGIDAAREGDLMRATVPAHLLFRQGSAELRPRARRLAEGIAQALRHPPAGQRHEVELLLGAGPDLSRQADPAIALSVRRAGSFARALRAGGAPQRTILIGVRPGDPDEAQISFYRRDDVRWKPALGGPR